MTTHLCAVSNTTCRLGVAGYLMILIAWNPIVSAQVEPTKSDREYRAQWYGELDAGSRLLRFVLEDSAGQDGSDAHWLRSIDEGDQRFRLDPFTVDDQRLEFALKATRATYSGQLSNGGRTATGKWKQRASEFDIVFRKVDEAPRDVPTELWVGTLNLVIQKLEIRFRIYDLPNGTSSILMDSVSQRAGGFKCQRTIDGANWTIKVPSLSGTFTGKRGTDSEEISGTWEQGGVPLALVLVKKDPGLPVGLKRHARPQTPREPFPYAIEQVEFQNGIDPLTLRGTLTIPTTKVADTASRFAAVILISGSGPQDRDETILDHKPFWVLADHLTRRGIAVLRYDERGVGESTGAFDTATSEDFARDVEGAFEFLRRHEKIDAAKIGLIGHSEGGIVAPIVAARRAEVAFIGLLAGTGVNGERILYSQAELILKAESQVADSDLKLQRVVQAALFGVIKNSQVGDKEEELVARATEQVKKDVSAEEFEKGRLDVAIPAGIARMHSPWFRFFLTHEPASVLQRVKCPVLALNGAKDLQVDPELNLPAIRKALSDGGNTEFETVVLPGLNHLFQATETGAVSEYESIEETLSPVMLDTLTNWLLKQTAGR